VIIGSINTALSEGDRLTIEELNQLLQDASLEAESLSHLIGNLLELSRSQASRLLIYPEPISLQDVIDQVVGAVKRQSPEHRLKQDVSSDLPFVRADQLRLERVLYNLLENATKYSPEGSDILVSAEKRNNSIVVSVSDDGGGINTEDQKKVFESFHRISEHKLAGITGTGLGLSVCKILVEAHGGSIWVESETGYGSTFSFSLPLR
ncbi:MAG: hypothetical protein GY852_07875, partial [bacterium]|nr:hypothetical protein [bacterium]